MFVTSKIILMKAYVFPGQGAQFPGMGKDLYENSAQAKEMFENANSILAADAGHTTGYLSTFGDSC